MTTYCTYVLHEKLLKTVVLNNIKLKGKEEKLEGNIGRGKLWRIWRMTTNSPKFNLPTFIMEKFSFQFCKQSIQ